MRLSSFTGSDPIDHTPSALVILKALAMGQRDKPKDAYDIDYLLGHIGIDEVAAGIAAMGHVDSVTKAVRILAVEFTSIDAIGPASVALYRRVLLRSPEADRVQALAFARVEQLLRRLASAEP